MLTSQIGILIVMALYIGVMVVVGAIFSKTNNSAGDFYLGGRKLGPFVTAMSAEASDMSSYLLMGLPGLAYLSGLADVGWTAIGLAIGTYLNWLIVSKRLRRYSEKTGSITIPDFFSNRFHEDKKVIELIAAIIIVIFFVPYTASGFAACGKLFKTLFGMDYSMAMFVSALIIVLYTMMGGFLAASTTDLIQSIVMTVALIIIVIYGVNVAGGVDAVIANAQSLEGFLSMAATHDPVSKTGSSYGFITIVSTMAWGLGYFGMPHILLRFMAIEDESKLVLSRRIASIWVVIAMGIAIFIGIVGLAMSNNGSIALLSGSDSETVIIQIASLLSQHGVLAIIAAGLTMSGILACTMSTADSQLLAASSSISQNILVDVFKVKTDERKNLVIARATVFVIAIIAIFIARDPNSSVFSIVSFAWAGFGATFGPLMLFSLFWKRVNRNGAIAGLVSGGVMVFVWKFLVRPLGGAFNIYELLPAFIVASIVIVVVSLLTKAPSKEIVEEFESI